jgi:hypothetical protein
LYFRPFTMVSLFSLVTTSMPLYVGSICGLAFVGYGY